MCMMMMMNAKRRSGESSPTVPRPRRPSASSTTGPGAGSHHDENGEEVEGGGGGGRSPEVGRGGSVRRTKSSPAASPRPLRELRFEEAACDEEEPTPAEERPRLSSPPSCRGEPSSRGLLRGSPVGSPALQRARHSGGSRHASGGSSGGATQGVPQADDLAAAPPPPVASEGLATSFETEDHSSSARSARHAPTLTLTLTLTLTFHPNPDPNPNQACAACFRAALSAAYIRRLDAGRQAPGYAPPYP